MEENFDNTVKAFFKTKQDEKLRLAENAKRIEKEQLEKTEKAKQWWAENKHLPPKMTEKEKENTDRLINGGFKIGETCDYGNLVMKLEQIDFVNYNLIFTVIDVGQYWGYHNGDLLSWHLTHCWSENTIIFEEEQSRNMEIKGCCAQRLLYVTDYGENHGGILVNAELDT